MSTFEHLAPAQPLTSSQLTGQDDSHIEYDDNGIGLHPDCWAALSHLRADAAEAGFDLQVVSGFRSFVRQLAIWNDKARGERPVHDDAGAPVAMDELSAWQKVQAILRYSALPGSSRHHWGSDLDVFDAAAMPSGYRLQLTPQEVSDQGMFGAFHRWLDERINSGEAAGFYRPYEIDRGGVAVERWHLSYAPLASACASRFDEQLLSEALQSSSLELAEAVLAEISDIYCRYIQVPPL